MEDPDTFTELQMLVKQLIDHFTFTEIKDDLERLKHILKEKEHEGLADVYVSLLSNPNLNREQAQELLYDLKTDDPEVVFRLRQTYSSTDVISTYLQKRNIILIKNECVELLKKVVPNESAHLEQLMMDLLIKADALYRFQKFLPYVDFLAIVKQVVIENPQSVLENFSFETIIQKATKGNNSLNARLFSLLNRNLSLSETTKEIKKLEGNKKVIVKETIRHLKQKVTAAKIVFDHGWQAAIEKAELYDYLRKQVQRDDTESIGSLLKQMFEDGEHLELDERIKNLNQVTKILEKEGCFTAIAELKLLQNQWIIQTGKIKKKGEYNRALEEAFAPGGEKKKETLGALFIKEFNQDHCLVALNHLPMSADELICLYSKVKDKKVLNKIKALLKKELNNNYQLLLKEKLASETTLFEAESKLLNKTRDVIRDSKTLHQERQYRKNSSFCQLFEYSFCL